MKNKHKLYAQAKKAIADNPIFFIEDLVSFLPCSKATFYKHFPHESDELNDIKGLLDDNKVKTKLSIRAKLFKSPKASELLALYRLICTDDERKMLNQNYVELTGKDGKDLCPNIQIEVIDNRSQADSDENTND